ncbi:thioredoxin-like protein [Hyaloraphidium curvatum]|nr:thioredoxin-like protein [Hyaloraphidium curvatum]
MASGTKPTLDVPPASALTASVKPHAVALRDRVVSPAITTVITSDRFARGLQFASRLRTGFPLPIAVFFQLDDPLALLAVQTLPKALAAFGGHVAVALRAVVSPDAPGLGDMERRYFRRDAACIAPAWRAAFPPFEDPKSGKALEQPPAEVLNAAARVMAWAENRLEAKVISVAEAFDLAARVGNELWSHAPASDRVTALGAIPGPNHALPNQEEADARIAANCALRFAGGGYDGLFVKTLGTWYGGPDRLAFLLSDLARITGVAMPSPSLYTPDPARLALPALPASRTRKIVVYASFRSPYSAILAQRLPAFFAAHPDWEWELKPVPPMITRGVPLSAAKRIYITLDSGRVQRASGDGSGLSVSDPLPWWGRAAAVYYHILRTTPDRAAAKEQSMLWFVRITRAAFLEGKEYGSDAGLAAIAAAAGVGADGLAAAMAQDHETWRAEMRGNTGEMNARGVWGVPSVSVEVGGRGGEMETWWGQDRMWVVEEAMRRAEKGSERL